MSLWIDITYVKQIGPRIDLFKVKKETSSQFLANARCPLCGDSSHKKNKARGYFFSRGDSVFYACHNCGASVTFNNFLKTFDPNLHQRYVLDKFKDSKSSKLRSRPPAEPKRPKLDLNKTKVDLSEVYAELARDEAKEFNSKFLDHITSIEDLETDHPAKQYVKDRFIPQTMWPKMFYVPKFVEWAKTNCDRFDEYNGKDHPRLVIPWYNRKGKIFAYQARAFGKEEPKYYSIVLDEEEQHVFGLERVNEDELVYVVEGPLDSMFLPNCVAVGNAGLLAYESKNAVYVWDAEARNPDIVKYVGRAITQKKSVVIWPSWFKHKDINDAVKVGVSEEEILNIIEKNTYTGISAKLRWLQWSKI